MPKPAPALSREAEQVFLHAVMLMEEPSSHGCLHEAQLGHFQQVKIGRAIARALLTELEQKGLIEERENKRQNALSAFGRHQIEWQLTPHGAYHALALRQPQATQPEEEAADTWSPLPLDNDDDLRTAIAAVEAVAERVRGDNGFAANEPENHKRIVWSLSAGADALRHRVPSAQQIRALLLQPLKWVGERFLNTAIGELSKEAVKAIVKLFDSGS